MLRPEISIITCVYNLEQFLAEAVQSVLNQTFANWELLLVDDGSSDGSTTIAKKYSLQHCPRIVYLEHAAHQNRGLSASRNLGIKRASGNYLAFLDADDVWLPTYLEQQLALAHRLQADVICEATTYWHTWAGADKPDELVLIGTAPDRLYLPPQLMLNLYPLGKGAAPCMCGVLVKKELVAKHKGFEEAFKGMYEDQVLLSKLYLNEQVYISSQHNNLYRQRPDSLVSSAQQGGEYHRSRKRYLVWLQRYLQETGMKHREVVTLLDQALLFYKGTKQPDNLKQLTKTFVTSAFPPRLLRLAKKVCSMVAASQQHNI